MVPAGLVSDKFSPRATMTVAMIGVAFFTASAAIVPLKPAMISLGILIAVRFLFGVFSAPVFPSAAALTVGWFLPKAYGRVQGLIAGITGLGGMFAPVVVVAIVAAQGWRASFVHTRIATLIVAILWHWRVRDGTRKPRIIPPWRSAVCSAAARFGW
jgi:MFS transporter, ACS family, glucarate transporter